VFAGVALVLIALTLTVAISPDIQGHVVAPHLDIVLDTVAAAVSIGVAVLAWNRFREDGEPIALFQTAAFLPLAAAYAIALLVAAALDSSSSMMPLGTDEQNFVFAAARLSTAVLLVLGGITSLGQWAIRRPLTLIVLALLPTTLVALLVYVVGTGGLPPITTQATSDPAALRDIAPLGLAFQLITAVMFLAAAWTIRRLPARRLIAADAYLSIGLLFAAFAEVLWAIFPSGHPAQVSLGDVLRLACFLALLLGIETEARDILRQLRRANGELESLREADLLRAQLEERARLARELHDGLAQDLWLAKLKAGRLATSGELSPDAGQLLREVEGAIEAGLSEARQAVMALRLSAPAGSNLCALMERHIEDYEDRFGLRVTFRCDQGADALPPRTQAELLRIVQEALVNVRQHADATVVRVTLAVGDDRLGLVISDNGRGFDPALVSEHSFGLTSMRERTQLIGGTLAIDTSPGDGTRITLEAPLAGTSPQASPTGPVITERQPA
jgi:signal transduction histidine kinase